MLHAEKHRTPSCRNWRGKGGFCDSVLHWNLTASYKFALFLYRGEEHRPESSLPSGVVLRCGAVIR